VPEDQTIRQATDADCRYIGVDMTRLDVGETVLRIKDASPEIYTCNSVTNARFCRSVRAASTVHGDAP
jgi:hypothetical protein